MQDFAIRIALAAVAVAALQAAPAVAQDWPSARPIH